MELVRVGSDDHIVLTCAECGEERPFEQPPCADGHGADCPEWACTECGAAVLVGPVQPGGEVPPVARSAAHPRAGRETGAGARDHRGRERAAARIPA
ncbi:hypothetical protein FF36_00736 [Frankia torreyi]|uniref:Uncharacterized protein n=1 Tax=Frankia torreyi TaxID=1856 RepID=A0A0D8BKH6_9ACTN|nr:MULTISPECIES: hypothetical protein [Frankia]KJE24733.1 hypothetical protein FF36_00736 [Frankia torreyi]KQC39143.1 hypothetical protein UK82_05610 [Frankia sp. ACN1ag]KQM07098.1 hypothetical protein FF86_1005189 [Frankia sp. CpI1-P]